MFAVLFYFSISENTMFHLFKIGAKRDNSEGGQDRRKNLLSASFTTAAESHIYSVFSGAKKISVGYI